MPGLVRFLSYIAVTVGCCAALYLGVVYLLTPDTTLAAERRPAPMPPRIAESIERRIPVPVREPLPPPRTEHEAASPPMTESKAALDIVAPAPKPTARIKSVPDARPKRPPKPPQPAVAAEAPRAPAAVSTARSDVPF